MLYEVSLVILVKFFVSFVRQGAVYMYNDFIITALLLRHFCIRLTFD